MTINLTNIYFFFINFYISRYEAFYFYFDRIIIKIDELKLKDFFRPNQRPAYLCLDIDKITQITNALYFRMFFIIPQSSKRIGIYFLRHF